MERKGRVYFIGAGPGDPELITVKGRRIIDSADVLIYAGSLINEKVLGSTEGKKVYNSATMSLDEIIDVMIKETANGKIVARIHDGDPSLYGALREQILLLEMNNIEYTIVPGVSSIFGAAATLKAELTIPKISQSITIARLAKRTNEAAHYDQIPKMVSQNSTLVFYLSIAYIKEIVASLRSVLPEDTPAAVVYRATWPDEIVLRGTLQDIVQAVWKSRVRKQALLIVGKAIDPVQQKYSDYKSKLYDKKFTHSYRKGIR